MTLSVGPWPTDTRLEPYSEATGFSRWSFTETRTACEAVYAGSIPTLASTNFSRSRSSCIYLSQSSDSSRHVGADRIQSRPWLDTEVDCSLAERGYRLHSLVYGFPGLCDVPVLSEIQQNPPCRWREAVLECESMVAAATGIGHEIECRRKTIAGVCSQHPEVLQMVIDISDGCIEYHVAKERGNILCRGHGVFAQQQGDVRIACHVETRTLTTQGAHAHHMQPPAVRRDVEAPDEQHAPSTHPLQLPVRYDQSGKPRESETGRLEADDVVVAVASAARELGDPLAMPVMDKRFGPCSAGTAAALEQFAEHGICRKDSGFELGGRSEQRSERSRVEGAR